MNHLNQKIALITGGTRGIGKACVDVFHREGWNTFATNSKSHDVRDFDACKRAVTDCLDKYGYLDCLVNNAGIVRNKAILMMAPDEWQDVIDINLTGVFNMSKAAVRPLIKNKGSIVNIGSISGLMGFPGQCNYSASKGGVHGLTKALARELARLKVRVNCVAPGLIDTDMTGKMIQVAEDEICGRIPMGKAGTANMVAERVYFLASEKAGYTTGNVDRVDGGVVAGSEG